jgi:hypothetical protein
MGQGGRKPAIARACMKPRHTIVKQAQGAIESTRPIGIQGRRRAQGLGKVGSHTLWSQVLGSDQDGTFLTKEKLVQTHVA